MPPRPTASDASIRSSRWCPRRRWRAGSGFPRAACARRRVRAQHQAALRRWRVPPWRSWRTGRPARVQSGHQHWPWRAVQPMGKRPSAARCSVPQPHSNMAGWDGQKDAWRRSFRAKPSRRRKRGPARAGQNCGGGQEKGRISRAVRAGRRCRTVRAGRCRAGG
jgi:hypothetical protein